MSRKEPLSRKLIFAVFYLLSSSFCSLLLNAVTVGFVARTLGVKNFGLYSAIFSFVQLFQFISDLGINKTLLKFGSKDLDKAEVSFGNALFVKSILIVPTISLMCLFGFFSGYRGERLLILLFLAISLIFDSYATIFSSIRRIFGNFKLISFFRVLRTAINLGIIFIVLSIKNSVFSLALGTMLLSIVVFSVSLFNTISILRPRLDLKLIKEFFEDSLTFSFGDFFSNIYSRISIVFLSFQGDLHPVGIFSAAVKFTRIANLLPAQIKFVFLPTMYRILEEVKKADENQTKARRIFKIMLRYMVIFATPAAFFIYFFSDKIIHLIFGNKYNLAIPIVQLFSLFIYLRFVETPFKIYFLGLNKHKILVTLQGLASLANVILCLVLIPAFSMYGAYYSIMISEILFALVLIFIGRKYSIWRLKNITITFLKPVLAGTGSLLLMLFLLGKLEVCIQLLFFLLFYVLFLLLIKAFNKEDKELFIKIFNMNKKVKVLS